MILDGGASNHIFNSRDHFIEYTHASTTDRYSLEQISQRLKELEEHELQSPQRRSRSEILCTYLRTKPTWYRTPQSLGDGILLGVAERLVIPGWLGTKVCTENLGA